MLDNLLLLLFINTVAALACLIIYFLRKRPLKGVWLSLFILVVPIVGALCLIFAEVYKRVYSKMPVEDLKAEALGLHEIKKEKIIHVDVEKEVDVIPLKEAMLTTDKKNRRKILLEVLKGVKDDSTLSVIRDATLDIDTEVSHYAIAFVTAYTSKYREQEEVAARNLSENPNMDTRLAYINCLIEITKPRFFTEFEQEAYLILLDEQYDILIKEDRNALTGLMLVHIIDSFYYLNRENYVDKYLKIAREMATIDLHTAKVCLRYLYKEEKRDEFLSLLEDVRVSSIEFDNEVLDWIRFYSGSQEEKQLMSAT